MKVVVFGATRGVGRAAVHLLLMAGHEVTAFARNPPALDLRHERLRVAAGDALDPVAVERAVEGQEGVIISLGVTDNPVLVRMGRGRTPVTVCSEGTRHILAAMAKHGVHRVVVVSAFGVGETREKLPAVARVIYNLLLKEQIADKERQEELVRASNTDWVIVQPVGLTNAPARGAFLASADGRTRASTISRADVAAFCVQQLTRDEYLSRSVAVSG